MGFVLQDKRTASLTPPPLEMKESEEEKRDKGGLELDRVSENSKSKNQAVNIFSDS